MLFQGELISTSLVYVQHSCCGLCQWPCTTGQEIQIFNGKYLVVLLVKYLVVNLSTNNETSTSVNLCFNTVRKTIIFKKQRVLKLFNMETSYSDRVVQRFHNKAMPSLEFIAWPTHLDCACCKVYMLLSEILHWILAMLLVSHFITKWWANCGFAV